MNTTREAALEAAAKNLVWAAQTSGGTAGRDEGLVAACDRMEAALSTPATEPQGYVEGLEAALRIFADVRSWMVDKCCDPNSAQFSGTSIAARALAARPAPQPAAEHEYPDPLIAEDRYEDDQPAADTRVVVKPLVWEDYAQGEISRPNDVHPEYCTAPSVSKERAGEWRLRGPWIGFKYYPTKEAAKAAAQADYETRILSALIGTAPSDKIAEAARDVLAERQRQISAEGWTPEHDDQHSSGQMALAAACYALVGSIDRSPGAFKTPLQNWPWQASWWKPTTPRRDLVKAGALIIAEIERLDRALAGKGE